MVDGAGRGLRACAEDGGVSVETALLSADPAAVTELPGDPAWQDPALARHLWARHLRAAVGQDAWQRAFTFAVVRNPWARLAS